MKKHLIDRGGRFIALVLVSVLSVAATSTSSGELQASEEPPTLLGLASAEMRKDVPALQLEAGKPPAFVALFWKLETTWPNPAIEDSLKYIADKGLIPFVEISTDDEARFERFADNPGAGDIDGLVETVKRWLDQNPGSRIIINPFPEANLPEHPWGGDPNRYKKAIGRVHELFRQAGIGPDKARFVFGMNGVGPFAGPGYSDYYPGDDVVDLIGFAKLNRGGDSWRDYQETFATHISEMQAEVSRTKPIVITQTGSVEDGGDRSVWLREMFQNLREHDQVVGAVYFNRNKNEGGQLNDYRVIVNGDVDPDFIAGYRTWSDPSQAEWIFDGRMDRWVQERAERITSAGFGDVIDSPFYEDITWLSNAGITRGCNPPDNTRFCPDDFVTRGQMAAFLVRGLNLSGSGDDRFVDTSGSVFARDIQILANAGITRGCNPPDNTRFCPDDFVTRGQMAAFLVRGLNLSGSGDDRFVDTSGSVFARDIQILANAGITRGCNPPDNTRFCPDDFVTRGQMAAFLHRGIGDQ